jgi:hypothetical protein
MRTYIQEVPKGSAWKTKENLWTAASSDQSFLNVPMVSTADCKLEKNQNTAIECYSRMGLFGRQVYTYKPGELNKNNYVQN